MSMSRPDQRLNGLKNWGDLVRVRQKRCSYPNRLGVWPVASKVSFYESALKRATSFPASVLVGLRLVGELG